MEITIKCPELLELAKAITLLAHAEVKLPEINTNEPQATITAPVQMAPAQQPQAPIHYQQPVQAYAAPVAQQFAPPVQQPVMSAQIPTSHVAQEFTLDQIQLAMSGLVDAGKMDLLHSIFAGFNVAAITQLQKDQYPLLVLKLREVGAKI